METEIKWVVVLSYKYTVAEEPGVLLLVAQREVLGSGGGEEWWCSGHPDPSGRSQVGSSVGAAGRAGRAAPGAPGVSSVTTSLH